MTRGQRLKDLVDRYPELARLLAVEIHLHLRIAGIEGGEEVGQLRPFRAASRNWRVVVAELLHAERAAAVLQQEVKAGRGAKPGDRRNIERKDDRLGNLRQLRLQARHDAAHMERFGMTLIPRLQTNENRAEVRLICAGHHAVAADGGKRLDSFGLGQDLLDLGQHSARALERRSGRQRHVDAEYPLVFLGDEAGGQRDAEKAGADSHRGDDDDGQVSTAAPGAVRC